MSENQQTADEVFESLTGFDELAIAQHFSHTIGELADQDASMFHRALIFVVKRRAGDSDDDARNAALGLSMKDHMAFFAGASDEESGKDEQPEEQPESSLSSVS